MEFKNASDLIALEFYGPSLTADVDCSTLATARKTVDAQQYCLRHTGEREHGRSLVHWLSR